MFIIRFSPNSDAWCPRISDSNPYFCPPNSDVVGTRHRQRTRFRGVGSAAQIKAMKQAVQRGSSQEACCVIQRKVREGKVDTFI